MIRDIWNAQPFDYIAADREMKKIKKYYDNSRK
jgi:hypothetical protein